jgi:hypothetical protein
MPAQQSVEVLITCSTTGRGYRTCSTIGRGSYSLTGRGLFLLNSWTHFWIHHTCNLIQRFIRLIDTKIQSQGYFALLTYVFRVIEGHKTLM